MQEFGLEPGPQLGVLLEKINEAQAAGEISNREEALALAKQALNS
jgi:poly(A) polymerase/tRNA nucleotidyltransferase (CCA-adding enzyme)